MGQSLERLQYKNGIGPCTKTAGAHCDGRLGGKTTCEQRFIQLSTALIPLMSLKTMQIKCEYIGSFFC
jgi:hypothetical protein